jgi:hypothetical protein
VAVLTSSFVQGYDLQNLRYVACKIHQLSTQWAVERKRNYTRHATREYEIHRSLSHPKIVPLFDVCAGIVLFVRSSSSAVNLHGSTVGLETPTQSRTHQHINTSTQSSTQCHQHTSTHVNASTTYQHVLINTVINSHHQHSHHHHSRHQYIINTSTTHRQLNDTINTSTQSSTQSSSAFHQSTPSTQHNYHQHTHQRTIIIDASFGTSSTLINTSSIHQHINVIINSICF